MFLVEQIARVVAVSYEKVMSLRTIHEIIISAIVTGCRIFPTQNELLVPRKGVTVRVNLETYKIITFGRKWNIKVFNLRVINSKGLIENITYIYIISFV